MNVFLRLPALSASIVASRAIGFIGNSADVLWHLRDGALLLIHIGVGKYRVLVGTNQSFFSARLKLSLLAGFLAGCCVGCCSAHCCCCLEGSAFGPRAARSSGSIEELGPVRVFEASWTRRSVSHHGPQVATHCNAALQRRSMDVCISCMSGAK